MYTKTEELLTVGDRSVSISEYEHNTVGAVTDFAYIVVCNIYFPAPNKFYITTIYTNINWKIVPIKMIGIFKYQ